MARKLKTFVTESGFFELAVAAPSMKAALRDWGIDVNLFQQGLARQTNDPAIVAAAEQRPGTVLRRPIGSKASFGESVELPKLKGAPAGGRSQSKAKTSIGEKAKAKPARHPAARRAPEQRSSSTPSPQARALRSGGSSAQGGRGEPRDSEGRAAACSGSAAARQWVD